MLRSQASRIVGGALGSVLAVLAVIPADAPIQDLAFRHVVSHEVRLVSNGLTQLGTTWTTAGLLGVLAGVGHWTADRVLVQASVGGAVGLILGGIFSQLTKQVVCRGRPGLHEGWGVDDPTTPGAPASARLAARRFFRWPCLTDSRHHSFPSGHATTAFAFAAALGHVAPARRAVWFWVAAGIGASRVFLNAHFLSDVVAGGLIGWWATHAGWGIARRLVPAGEAGVPSGAAFAEPPPLRALLAAWTGGARRGPRAAPDSER